MTATPSGQEDRPRPGQPDHRASPATDGALDRPDRDRDRDRAPSPAERADRPGRLSNLTGQLAGSARLPGHPSQHSPPDRPAGSASTTTTTTSSSAPRHRTPIPTGHGSLASSLRNSPETRLLNYNHRHDPSAHESSSGALVDDPHPGHSLANSSPTPRSFLAAQHPNSSSFKSIHRFAPLGGLSSSHRESSADDLTEDQKAVIVRRHLMNKDEQRAARRQHQRSRGASEQLDGNDFSDLEAGLDDDQDESRENTEGAIEVELEHGQHPPSASTGTPRQEQQGPESDYPVPFHLQGGDIHHAVYKWANKRPAASHLTHLDHTRGSNPLSLTRTRSLSMSVASVRGSELGGFPSNLEGAVGLTERGPSPDTGAHLTHKEIMEPGGFRRAFLYQKRAAIGKPYEPSNAPKFTKSFIDFLSLYGHFGGEDLEEIDEREEAAFRALHPARSSEVFPSDSDAEEAEESRDQRTNETSPLLSRSSGRQPYSRLRRGVSSQTGVSKYPGFRDGSNGNATVNQAVLMALKSLVGTGVLFLARAFANGGMIFSIAMLTVVALISLYSYILLVETRLQIPGGFGEIAGILYGPWLRRTVLFSLVISQLGFVSAYTIFIAQNLQAFVMAVTHCKTFVPVYVLIFGQLIAYLPLAMIRNIQKLSWTALIADVFILIGLVYLFGYEFSSIASHGIPPIKMFNHENFPLMIGTAVFAFEGIGLVIPITESMKEPQKFPGVLIGVMIGLTLLFAAAGACGYAAFGSDVQTVVLVNLPQDDKSVNAVQFLYSMAIMLSTPLQLFPAVRIMENGLFSESGKYSNKVKWEKNFFRIGTVTFCSVVAWMGASDLDKFVSLIGSVACVPLCFCYPAMLHYKAIARSLRQKLIDIALILFGIVAAVYTTYQTVLLIFTGGEESGKPPFGNCS